MNKYLELLGHGHSVKYGCRLTVIWKVGQTGLIETGKRTEVDAVPLQLIIQLLFLFSELRTEHNYSNRK